MATLLAAGAASAAGYAIGSFASKSSKRGKSKRPMTYPIPPPPPLLPPAPLIYQPHPAALHPYMTRPARVPPHPFAQPFQRPNPLPMHRAVPPPPPLPLARPLAAGESSRPKKHTDTSSCAVCKQPYQNGDVVARMWCKHMVHKACLEETLNMDVVEDLSCNCPHCGSKSYVARFAVAENQEQSRRETTLPGMMPTPMDAQVQPIMQAGAVVQPSTPVPPTWDPARVSPVFFGRYQPADQSAGHMPVKGIVVSDKLSPLPASAKCSGNGCTPFFYNLRGGGPSCTLCDCAQCKQGQTCETCGKCKCATCQTSACTCACKCAPSSPSVSALSFSDNESESAYSASYASTSVPDSSGMYSSVTGSAFQQFAYQ